MKRLKKWQYVIIDIIIVLVLVVWWAIDGTWLGIWDVFSSVFR